MAQGIRVCQAWSDHHERPVYTLGDTCPSCGGSTITSGPAPFNPRDPYGAYRRALKRREVR